MIVTVEDPVRGDYQMIGCPVKLSDEHVKVTPAPRLGEHTDEVLTQVLGCTEDEVNAMKEEGVI